MATVDETMAATAALEAATPTAAAPVVATASAAPVGAEKMTEENVSASASATPTQDAAQTQQNDKEDRADVAEVQQQQNEVTSAVFREKGGKKEGREKQAREPEQEGRNSYNRFRKRQRTDGGGQSTDFPKSRDEMSPEHLQQRIKRQIEYYFSDESLMYDSFFQEKMKEASKQGLGESLDLRFVLTSPRMQQLKITEEEVLTAVKDSSLVKSKRTDEGHVYLYREIPLPELKERFTRRGTGTGGGGGGATTTSSGMRQINHGLGKNCHAVGCFLRVRNIPAEAKQWQQVKDAVRAAIPGDVLVRYVSNIETVPVVGKNATPSSTRQCWVLLAPYENDYEMLEKQQPLKISFAFLHGEKKEEEKEGSTETEGKMKEENIAEEIATATEAAGATGGEATGGEATGGEATGGEAIAEAVLMHEREVKKACCEMPARMRLGHEKDIQQLRRQLAALPLLLQNEIKFNSVEHLRKCVAEFLEKTGAGEQLRSGGAAEKAVLALLEYHPKAFFKKGGRERRVVGVKVGIEEKQHSQGKTNKCFYIIRKHIETGEEDEEDFSVNKCIAELAKDPPCEPEALKQLLKTRNEAYAEKRAHAAAQAETRRRNKEEAVRVAGSSRGHTPAPQTRAKRNREEALAASPPVATSAAAASSSSSAEISATAASSPPVSSSSLLSTSAACAVAASSDTPQQQQQQQQPEKTETAAEKETQQQQQQRPERVAEEEKNASAKEGQEEASSQQQQQQQQQTEAAEGSPDTEKN